LGTHYPRLDDKGRLFLPAKFRDQVSGGIVITRGQERCLFGYTVDEFERITQRMSEATTTQRSARDYQRMFFSSASLETPDKQGRITLPAELRDYAGLSHECAVAGVNTRLEIWDMSAWESYRDSQEVAFAELSEEGMPGLL